MPYSAFEQLLYLFFRRFIYHCLCMVGIFDTPIVIRRMSRLGVCDERCLAFLRFGLLNQDNKI
jgi:hypothetical protein